MANDDNLVTTADRPLAVLVYESDAQAYYDVCQWFLAESSAEPLLHSIAKHLLDSVSESRYERYARLLGFRALYEELKRHASHLKAPLHDIELEAALCVILRERFKLSCIELSAVFGASEGSIRTRLERARLKAFPLDASRESRSDAETASFEGKSDHSCLRSHQLIEDFDEELTPSSQEFAPLSKAIDDCSKCRMAAQLRLKASSYFAAQALPLLPQSLKIFPLKAFPLKMLSPSSLLIKEGHRFSFNWSVTPWYFKALIEGILATALVLGIVLSIPQIKSFYEFWTERRIDLYTIAEVTAGSSGYTEAAPAAAPSRMPLADATMTSKSKDDAPPIDASLETQSEFTGKDSKKITSDRLVRVLFKTDAPETAREQLLEILAAMNYSSADDGSNGELPGGMMINVFIPLSKFEEFKKEFARKLGSPKIIITRAKERGSPGHAHLKIWLQRV